MALTTTNAQITVQDGQGAATNVNNGNVGFFTPGALVSFALQSTTGVAKWKLTFICPAFPSLHQKTFEWVQGQANLLQQYMPATPSPIANPYGGIEVVSVVDDGVQSIAQSVCFLQTYGGAAPTMVRTARVVSAAALDAYTASGGVLTANATGTQTAVDGVTVNAGDKVLLCTGAAAADNGLYIVTVKGAVGVKWVWTRAPEWATGATIQSGSTIEIGPEGTLFANTTWKVTATGNPVVDTNDPLLFPGRVTQSVTLVTGFVTKTNVPILSTTKTAGIFMPTNFSGASTTVSYRNGSYASGGAATAAGAIGTGSISVTALVAAGTFNTNDVGTGSLTIINW